MEQEINFGERALNSLLSILVVVLVGILISVVVALGLSVVGII